MADRFRGGDNPLIGERERDAHLGFALSGLRRVLRSPVRDQILDQRTKLARMTREIDLDLDPVSQRYVRRRGKARIVFDDERRYAAEHDNIERNAFHT